MRDSRPVPFAEILESLLQASELLGRSSETDRGYRGAAERFVSWAKVQAPELLVDLRRARRQDFERYLLDRHRTGVAWSTLKTEWQRLRSILQRGVRDERLSSVPQVEVRWEAKIAEDRRRGRTPERGQRVLELVPLCLEAADELAYHRELSQSLPALFRFFAYTGARCGEVLSGGDPDDGGLRWADVEHLDTESPVAVIRGGKGRVHGPRRIPIPEPAARGLRELVRGAPEDLVWPWQRVPRSWMKVREHAATTASAELAGPARQLRLHDLRHFASHYWRSLGVPDRLIDRLLGHRTPVIAARYAAADEREIANACAQALRTAPSPPPDGRGAALSPPDLVTIDFAYWSRVNGARGVAGAE